MSKIQQFIPAKLHVSKTWYISYYAYNPATDKLELKRVKLMRIKSISERRKYAKDLINRINEKLYSGWNPFIDQEKNKSYNKLLKAINHFLIIAEKKLSDDVIRYETIKDYRSYLSNLQKWLENNDKGDIYVYQFDKKLISDFLEHIYIERKRTATTRNNYLNFMRVFSGFLIEKDYLNTKPTDGLKSLRKSQKQRKVINDFELRELWKYLENEDIYYLLACRLLYYTFIRPKEMSYIQIKHISINRKIIFVPGVSAKNRKNAIVTIPKKLIDLLIELDIMKHDPDHYLFSDNFAPGKIRKSEKRFRDRWLKIRKALNFPDTYKFYSLKDTGITDMIRKVGDPLIVRDQARHHSVSVTDTYTNKELQHANRVISDLEY